MVSFCVCSVFSFCTTPHCQHLGNCLLCCCVSSCTSLSVSLSICLSICLSAFFLLSLSVCLSVCLSSISTPSFPALLLAPKALFSPTLPLSRSYPKTAKYTSNVIAYGLTIVDGVIYTHRSMSLGTVTKKCESMFRRLQRSEPLCRWKG